MFQRPASTVPSTLYERPRLPVGELGLSSFGLGDLWAVAWRRKAWIIGAVMLGISAALCVALLVPPHYTASAQILVEPNDLRVVENVVTEGSSTSDTNLAQVENQVHVLTSRNVLERVVGREGLMQDPEFVGDGAPSLLADLKSRLTRFGLGRDGGQAVEPRLQALSALERRVSVRRAERSFVIDVAVTTKDRWKSARIANAIVAAFLDEQAAARSDAAGRASHSLSARLGELRAEVEAAEARVVDYMERNNIVSANGQLIDEQQLSEVNRQLVAAQAAAEEAQSRLEQVRRLQGTGLDRGAVREAIESPTIAALRGQYSQIKRAEADAASRYGPRHPTLADIRAQLRDVEALIAEEIARIAATAQSELDRALANEAAARARLKELERRSAVTGGALVRLRELQREAEASRAVYEAFLVRARETGEQGRLDMANARVISPAEPPLDKSWPPRTVFLLAGGILLGTAAGSSLALLRELADTRIWSPRRAEALTGLPVLALIQGAGGRRGSTRRAPVLSGPSGLPGRDAAELARLLSRLPARGTLGRAQRVLVLAADEEQEGTEVVIALARLAAAADERVLVVDGDERGRTVARLIGGGTRARDDEGVKTTEDALHDPESGFDVLAPNPRVGRNAAALHESLCRASDFDLVLIDAGAALSNPAAHGYAGLCDDIVVLAKIGRTRMPDLLDTLAALGEHQGKLQGLVLTRGGRA
jgi:succinoglycan biosynthesis transport protein ExoP